MTGAAAETRSAAAPTPGAVPARTALSTAAPMPTAFLARTQALGTYPDNPELQISGRFAALRQQSRYIVGWLTVNALLDEAVVQRDNTFYLDHDAKGNENANGAVFLEASIPLKSRPDTYILYGHNMKTGAMFGCLRHFENRSYYIAHPFLTFDTMYETGRYVVFAVANTSTAAYDRNYVDFHDLRSGRAETRLSAIDALLSASAYTCPIDVSADDQLLLLVTCTEKDRDRRVVAARRLRDGEDEADLLRLLERTGRR